MSIETQRIYPNPTTKTSIIKIQREAWGLSREDLGDAIGYSEEYIRQIEQRQRLPRPCTAVKIARVFAYNLNQSHALRHFLAEVLDRPGLALHYLGENVSAEEMRQRLEPIVHVWGYAQEKSSL